MVSFERKAGAQISYEEYQVDGIRVFVAKNIKCINETMHIVLRSFLFFKSLDVIGVELMK